MKQGVIAPPHVIQDLCEFLNLGSAGFTLPSASAGVMLLLLEHKERFDDRELEALFPWSEEDLQRICSFTHREARTSWCFSRFLARHALASVTGLDPRQLTFGSGPFGKPFLLDNYIRFNWSHTPGCVVLALAFGNPFGGGFGGTNGDLGCDVEDTCKAVIDFGSLAYSLYSDAEREWLEAVPDPRTNRVRFLALYVQKEARLKASGTGIGLGKKLADVRAFMRDPPFREGDLACFRHGKPRDDSGSGAGDERGRYMVALCAPAIGDAPLTLRTHHFGDAS